MSTVKISELTALTSADAADELVIVDDSAGVTKKITQGNLNVLIENADDYEEGTWTPALNFGGNSVSLTYSFANGYYIKVGRLVYVTFAMGISNKGSSTGEARVTGFPYTISTVYGSTSVTSGATIGYSDDISNAYHAAFRDNGYISFYSQGGVAPLTETIFTTSSSSMRISGWYATF